MVLSVLIRPVNCQPCTETLVSPPSPQQSHARHQCNYNKSDPLHFPSPIQERCKCRGDIIRKQKKKP